MELNIQSLQQAHQGANGELDSTPYIADRLKQLAKERTARAATMIEVRERAAGEMELELFGRMAASLDTAVRSGSMSRASAQAQLREFRLSRLNAHRVFVDNLK